MCLPRSDANGAGGSGQGSSRDSSRTNQNTNTNNNNSNTNNNVNNNNKIRKNSWSSGSENSPKKLSKSISLAGDIKNNELVNSIGNKWWWSAWRYALVALAGVLTYYNSLRGDFVHDDIVAIVKNVDVTGQTPLLDLFANDFWGVPMKDPSSHKSYRPLTTLTFRMNAILSAENVIGYHVVNVILHVIVSVQLADFCRRCLAWNWLTSFTAAILFATHPVHTEAVSSIVGRAELLCCTFFMLGLTLFISSGSVRSGRRLFLVCGCAFCAMLAKEQGVTLLLVCLAYHLIRRHQTRWKRRRSWHSFLQRTALDKSSLTLVASLAVMVGFRLWILLGSMPVFSDQDNPASHSPHFLTRLLTYLYLPALNVSLLLCPLSLSYDWQLGSVPLVNNLSDPRNLASLALYATLALLIRKLWTVPKNSTREELTVGVCILTIPFLPAANLFFPVGFVVAERILYTPSIGYCILVARGIREISRRHQNWGALCLVRVTVAILVALLWLRSVRRNEDWTNRETLFRSGLRSSPDNAKVHYNFANLQKDNGYAQSAIDHYRKALSLWPNYVSAHNNLGTLLVDPEEAEFHFKTAMWLDPKHARAHYNLAALYRRRRQPEVVIWLLNRAIELDPDLDEAYVLLTSVYTENEKTQNKVKLTTKEKIATDKWLKSTVRRARSPRSPTSSSGVINQTTGSANRPSTSALLYPMAVGERDHVVKR